MAYTLGTLFGSLLMVLLISGALHHARKRRGVNEPIGAIIYAVWVSMALYGLGSREDYSWYSALNYAAAGGLVALVVAIRAAMTRPAKKPIRLS